VSWLVLGAYRELLVFEFCLARGDFSAVYAKVRNSRTRGEPANPKTLREICAAVDMACVWYWKEVRCLQRSAVTTRLLRYHGVSAQMIIGTQLTPFRAHAWVEIEGCVVNDKPYVREMFAVLDRC
jgi:Transglutaminase-like superfamily